ncbi:MAG: protease complex subunit PrcB family protein [Pyrinomonadaceae bacterium]
MLKIHVSLLLIVMSLAANGAGAAGCGAKSNNGAQKPPKNSNAAQTPTPAREGENVTGSEMKVLAEGAYSKVQDAFIAVARDVETYAALRDVVESLPEQSADYFEKNLVVAAFLGQRRSGGYGVEIAQASKGHLSVSERTPPKGSMTTQALTAPFKIVSIKISDEGHGIDEAPAIVEADVAWQRATRTYRVASGDFKTGGGFAGRFENLKLEGELRAMRYGKLATVFFNLKGTGGAKARALTETATGIVQDDGSITLPRLDPNSLVDVPRGALRASGRLTENESKLSLSFESLPTIVADGFGGTGKLEAVATTPAPAKKSASNSEEPM